MSSAKTQFKSWKRYYSVQKGFIRKLRRDNLKKPYDWRLCISYPVLFDNKHTQTSFCVCCVPPTEAVLPLALRTRRSWKAPRLIGIRMGNWQRPPPIYICFKHTRLHQAHTFLFDSTRLRHICFILACHTNCGIPDLCMVCVCQKAPRTCVR